MSKKIKSIFEDIVVAAIIPITVIVFYILWFCGIVC